MKSRGEREVASKAATGDEDLLDVVLDGSPESQHWS